MDSKSQSGCDFPRSSRLWTLTPHPSAGKSCGAPTAGTYNLSFDFQSADTAAFNTRGVVIYTNATSIFSATIQGSADPDDPALSRMSFSGSVFLNSGQTVDIAVNRGPDGVYFNDSTALRGTITLAAIPEPETYAMLLAGLGLLGFAARRRKQAEAA